MSNPQQGKFELSLLKVVGAILMALFINLLARKFGESILKLFENIWNLAIKGGLLAHMGLTVKRFIVGYMIAVVTAIPIGILVGRVARVAAVLDIPIELLRPIPSAVIIPLSLAFMGLGEPMKILVIWFGAFWPMLVFTRQACRTIDPILLETARVFEISPLRTLFTVVLPACTPMIFGAARTGLAIALLLAITVEMIAGGDPRGLGYFIIESERSFRQGYMLAGIVVVALIGYVFNLCFSWFEGEIRQWRFQYYGKPF